MLRFDIVSCLPEVLSSCFTKGIVGRAIEQQKIAVFVHNLRDYSENKHRKVDDYAYGGGAGMVLGVAPIHRCIQTLTEARKYREIILFSPRGKRLEQPMVNRLGKDGNLMLICGRYKGFDERVRTWATMELSMGDYVLSGGEPAAWVLCDAVARLFPGVMNDENAAKTDSFQIQGLGAPLYTRPKEYLGMKVPDVLLSGDAKRIEKWREEKAKEITQKYRPDLL